MHTNNYNETKKANPGHNQKHETTPAVPAKRDEQDRNRKDKVTGDKPARNGTPEVAVK